MESVSILTLDFLLSLYMLLPSIEGRSYVIFSSISYLPCNQKCGFWDWQWLLLLSAVVLLLCIRPAVGKFSIGTAQTLAPPFSTCHCLLHFGEADESHSCLSSIRFQLYTVPGSDSVFPSPQLEGFCRLPLRLQSLNTCTGFSVQVIPCREGFAPGPTQLLPQQKCYFKHFLPLIQSISEKRGFFSTNVVC